MKLNTTSSPVEMQGQLEQGSFGIKQSPKAFQILSSGLYSNKPMAIVRELSANAADAHVLNNNQATPFEIKLPNRLDNQFYLKDFGPGLSHEQVMRLYTTYFDSTKSESNDFIGGLGLGSKSPFSYTDAFTVESRQNGTKRTYSAFVAESGIPQIVQLGAESPTDEPDGLTVGFPVNPADYKNFVTEAQRILPWFDPMPKVLGANIEPLEAPLRQAEDLAVYKRIPVWAENAWSKETFVRMGHILYPLDWNAAGLSDDEDMMTILKSSGRNSFVFNVPIGSVEVAASREGLQYDRGSKAHLKLFAEGLMSKIGSVIETDIKKIQAQYKPFEAQARLSKMQNDWGFTFKTASDILAKRKLEYPALKSASEIKFPVKDYATFDLALAQPGQRSMAAIENGRYNKGVAAGTVPLSIQPGSVFLILESDSRGYVGAAKSLLATAVKEDFFDSARYTAAVVIVPKDMKKLKDPAYLAERDAFLESIGSPPLRQTSEYVNPKRTSFGSSAAVAKEEIEGYVLKGSIYSRSSIQKKIFEPKELTSWVNYQAAQNDVYYTDKSGKERTISATEFLKIHNILSEAAATLNMPSPGTLIGVTGKYAARLKKHASAPEKNAFEWMLGMLKDPKVQNLLSVSGPVEHKPEIDTNEWSFNSNVRSFVAAVAQHKEFFAKQGDNWKLLSKLSTSQPDGDKIKEVLGEFFKDRNFDTDIKITRVNTPATFKKLAASMPMLAMTLKYMEQNKDRSLLKDIKFFLDAKGNPDLDLVYSP